MLFGNLALELSDCSEELRRPLSRFQRDGDEIEACLKKDGNKESFRYRVSPVELAAPIVSLWQGGMLLTKTHKDSRAMRDGIKVLTVCMG